MSRVTEGEFYLGIDFGTSGARAVVVNQAEEIKLETRLSYSAAKSRDLGTTWRTTLFNLLGQIPLSLRRDLGAIAINGTSSTVLLSDSQGQLVTEPLLYNDARGKAVLNQVQELAPANHLVCSATSSLAKLLWWQQQDLFPEAAYFLHQADWLSFLLHGKLGISDYHNALKLGYDVAELCYPDWLEKASWRNLLPEVLAPGTGVDVVKGEIAERYELPSHCLVATGTTDSIAAFLASGASQPGEAVTSLGSTLVLKLLSHVRLEATEYGIYSHRLGNLWLAGGASNTGGAVLKQFFSEEELVNLSKGIDPNVASPLQYYPLLEPGERFPVNDADLSPQLTPRPEDPQEFLHGLLESMARIEARGYQLLQSLGATPLQQVYTAGGGAKNSTWTQIRQRHLGVPVFTSANIEAAYGTALLVKRSNPSA